MQAAIRFEDHKGLIHNQAKRGLKWAHGAGLALDYDDMLQEASIAFLLAAEGYREDSGYKFSAYFTMAAFSQFRKAIGIMTGVKNLNPTQRKEIADRKAHNEAALAAGAHQLPEMNYGLAPVCFSHLDINGEDGMRSFESTLESTAATPEEQYAFKQAWEQATANLSPLAQLVVDWLREPPPQLLQELASKRAHANACKAKGAQTKRFDEGISIRNVTDFLALIGDLTRGEITLVEAELAAVGARLEKANQND